ncbi:hypothetical protein PTSG_04782 [Salpingoeca rosetta]|uniref:CNNM transmembrane domain-containing protein n=1 Tax=Salpingoeca rosetta (strain ATCC 50818 / BSB-021) TaxID=946362 RepID=F2U9P1_SALR5|nr:uncharacterized protein PTSG_04782 [Salpingoeca rosetta]EGD73068.1 hypothetical protein PTSG_04782 [Salpingoeca rosetta]|eukprot:XP_004994099.1 hypothetical protein PTSG_04782 [Salpingoeca rosetta]
MNVTCTTTNNLTTVVCDGIRFTQETSHYLTPGSAEFFVNIGISAALVLLAGVFSGLTLGLLSLDSTQLQVLSEAGKPEEQKYARRIKPLVKRHHLLLVTLLLANAAVNESLPLFLDDLVPEYIAIIISVTAVLMFGEVIPQALCSKYGLAIGAFFAPMVTLLMLVMLPIGWPLSKLLDLILGEHHSAFFRRAELGVLVNIHTTNDEDNEEPLTSEEVAIIQGALELNSKTAEDAMQPLDVIYMLHVDRVYSTALAEEILERGHSRIPVFKDTRHKTSHFILTKTLIQYHKNSNVRIADIRKHALTPFPRNMGLYACLKKFREGKSHIGAVLNEDREVIGILTLEDVIEELLGAEIVDETDQFVDVARRILASRRRLSSTQRASSSAMISRTATAVRAAGAIQVSDAVSVDTGITNGGGGGGGGSSERTPLLRTIPVSEPVMPIMEASTEDDGDGAFD